MISHEIHGKLTGAGGDGGCVLGFYIGQTDNSTPDNVIKAIQSIE